MFEKRFKVIDQIEGRRHDIVEGGCSPQSRFMAYAFERGERVLILGGDGRLGQVTPPA
jgi:hypothetical protein